jgi:hypothetical protein
MKNLILAALSITAILLSIADLWSHSTTVHAQFQSSKVYVDLVPLTGSYGSGDVRPHGGTIVGFSCVANSTGNSCYLASQ